VGLCGVGGCSCILGGRAASLFAQESKAETPPQVKKPRSQERIEFAEKWVTRFFDVFDANLDPETRKKIMMANGRNLLPAVDQGDRAADQAGDSRAFRLLGEIKRQGRHLSHRRKHDLHAVHIGGGNRSPLKGRRMPVPVHRVKAGRTVPDILSLLGRLRRGDARDALRPSGRGGVTRLGPQGRKNGASSRSRSPSQIACIGSPKRRAGLPVGEVGHVRGAVEISQVLLRAGVQSLVGLEPLPVLLPTLRVGIETCGPVSPWPVRLFRSREKFRFPLRL